MTSFISLKLTADPVVKEAVDCHLQSEGAWTKKFSTPVECQEIFESISNKHVIPNKRKLRQIHFFQADKNCQT